MKKVLMLIICIGFIFADKVQILGTPNIRVAPDSKAAITTNKIVYDVLGTHGDYYKVKITQGSDNVGKSGWAWIGGLDMNSTKAEAIIKEPGLVLRAKPTKNSDRVCLVKTGAVVNILECKVTWYQIALGWIYKGAVKLIKE